MRIDVRNSCADFNSYRAARVKSLFNVDTGSDFSLTADLPVEDDDWNIGMIVGPSGSGKTSMGRQIWGGAALYEPGETWPKDKPIVDAIAPDGSFDDLTASLSAVGLGDVPAWLRPYHVLSNGERFRADLARIISEAPDEVIIDEFSSVVDRQVAKIGAHAFAKGWRRTGNRAILLSCHYDIIEWVQPDWVFDTASGSFQRGCLQRRPAVEMDIIKTNWRYWGEFEPHHYLKLPKMVSSCCYVGVIDGQRVAHVGVAPQVAGKTNNARFARFVVLPEWQGLGIGTRFLNAIAEAQLQGHELARLPGRKLRSSINTSHPGLCRALRRDPRWRQLTAVLHGVNKGKSGRSIARTTKRRDVGSGKNTGYGGHFRAVQGFRYYGTGDRG